MFNPVTQSFLASVVALLGGGVGLWAFVAAAKRIVPFLNGRTAVLRALGLTLSAVGVLLTKAATGQLEGADIQTAVVTILESVSVWLTAHAVHKASKPSP